MSNKRLIIGLIGPKGSGKDYTAQVLCKQYDFKRVAFADPIKKTISALFKIDLQDLETLKRDNTITIQGLDKIYTTLHGRDFVRNIGMLMRSYDDEQFNRYVRDFIDDCYGNVVVTDVRFANEYQLIKQHGGFLIEVVRPGVEYDHHITESGTLKGDFVLVNDENFDVNLQDILTKLK